MNRKSGPRITPWSKASPSAGPEFETDRAKFIGRGRELRAPLAMLEGRALSGTIGTVLDAVFALRYRLRVPAGGTARIAFWTCVAPDRAQLLELADKHRDPNAHTRAATLAWTQAQVQLRHFGIDASQANLFQQLAGTHPVCRRRGARRPATTSGAAPPDPQALWSQGISGDLPIVLLRVEDVDDLPMVRQLLQAHEYWGIKRLSVDLVILNERGASYVQDLQVALEVDGARQPQRARASPAPTRAARCSCCAPISSPPKRARCCSRSRASCCRAGAAASPTRSNACSPFPRWRRGCRGARRSPAAPLADHEIEARRLEFFNGTRRLRRAGPRIRASPRRRPEHAGALDQRDRQPRLRLPGVGRWRRLSPGRATAARTRSRPGATIRSPTGRARLSTCATRNPASCGRPTPAPIRHEQRALLLRARHGLQPLRAASRTASRSS